MIKNGSMYLDDMAMLCYKNTKHILGFCGSLKRDVLGRVRRVVLGFFCSNHECLLLLACYDPLLFL